MGFSSGSELAEKLWHKLYKFIPEQNKGQAALDIVDILEDYDCDTMCECDFVEEYLEYTECGWKIK